MYLSSSMYPRRQRSHNLLRAFPPTLLFGHVQNLLSLFFGVCMKRWKRGKSEGIGVFWEKLQCQSKFEIWQSSWKKKHFACINNNIHFQALFSGVDCKISKQNVQRNTSCWRCSIYGLTKKFIEPGLLNASFLGSFAITTGRKGTGHGGCALWGHLLNLLWVISAYVLCPHSRGGGRLEKYGGRSKHIGNIWGQTWRWKLWASSKVWLS